MSSKMAISKNYLDSKIFEFFLVIFYYVFLDVFEVIQLGFLFDDFFIEIVYVELVFDFRLDWRLNFESIYIIPVNARKPRMLQNLLCVSVPDSLLRVLFQALFNQIFEFFRGLNHLWKRRL